jgi:glycerophosphoryl diester phosphodiesterase
MTRPACLALGLVTMLTLNSTAASAANRPLVIAHRGASGYLPEHTLESATYAHAQGADYIEQDLVMSRDDVLVVLHDIHLDTTTDVAEKFPDRHRKDGRYYIIDFDWEELKTLTVRERFDPRTQQPVFPLRFPANSAPFRLCTMEEQLLLITGLNHSTRRKTGLYPEIKQPAWHHEQGKDIGVALIALLDRFNFNSADSPVFVQCFEPDELIRLRELTKTQLQFIQLIGTNSPQSPAIDYDALQTPAGLKRIATYAQGIGPSLHQIMTGQDERGSPQFSSLMEDAHAVGLLVHPYTLRLDSLPAGVSNSAALIEIFLARIEVDGIFTDHAGPVRSWVDQHFPPHP